MMPDVERFLDAMIDAVTWDLPVASPETVFIIAVTGMLLLVGILIFCVRTQHEESKLARPPQPEPLPCIVGPIAVRSEGVVYRRCDDGHYRDSNSNLLSWMILWWALSDRDRTIIVENDRTFTPPTEKPSEVPERINSLSDLTTKELVNFPSDTVDTPTDARGNVDVERNDDTSTGERIEQKVETPRDVDTSGDRTLDDNETRAASVVDTYDPPSDPDPSPSE